MELHLDENIYHILLLKINQIQFSHLPVITELFELTYPELQLQGNHTLLIPYTLHHEDQTELLSLLLEFS